MIWNNYRHTPSAPRHKNPAPASLSRIFYPRLCGFSVVENVALPGERLTNRTKIGLCTIHSSHRTHHCPPFLFFSVNDRTLDSLWRRPCNYIIIVSRHFLTQHERSHNKILNQSINQSTFIRLKIKKLKNIKKIY